MKNSKPIYICSAYRPRLPLTAGQIVSRTKSGRPPAAMTARLLRT